MTNSERRVQRVRKALDPPGEAKDDIWIIVQLAKRLGVDWGEVTAHDAWEELRTLSPMHAGMSYERLEELGGIQWPCPDESHPGTLFLHERLWEFDDPETQGTKAPFSVVIDDPPVDALDAEFPLRLTTGRRLDSYNTGVQTSGYTSPLRRPESIEVSPEDAERLGIDGGRAGARSRRAAARWRRPCTSTTACVPGSSFMTLHFPEQVETNKLTIEANDPKSGTAEFKATAVRIEKLADGGRPRTARGSATRSDGGAVDLHLTSAAADRRGAGGRRRAARAARDRLGRRRARDGGVGTRFARGGRDWLGSSETCCSRRSTRCSRASGGSARAASTTCASD